VSWHVNVTLQSAEEGLAYELPSHLMFVSGVVLLAFGLASLIAGARLAEILFALCLATAIGFMLVQEQSRDFLQGDHLEVELLTTWATTSWWGNMSTEPKLRGSEMKFPMDLNCAFTLFVRLRHSESGGGAARVGGVGCRGVPWGEGWSS
jgi:hypothetical protein